MQTCFETLKQIITVISGPSNSTLPCIITFFSYFCMLRILDDTLQILYDNKMCVIDYL